jgi:hypothetical protein
MGGRTSVSGNPSGGGSDASGSSKVAGGSIPTTANAKSRSGKKSAKTKATLTDDAGASTAPVSAGLKENQDVGKSVSSAPKTESTEPIEELEQDVDQTSSRAVAASDSLDSMRRQLSSQGMNLRGDISSSEEMMKVNLDKARQALQNQDTKSARRYLTMAQAQMEKIEKFLGH